MAGERDGFDLRSRERGFAELGLDLSGIEVPEGRAGEEGRRIPEEEFAEGLNSCEGEFVPFDPVPGGEKEEGSGFENTVDLAVGGKLVWEEHHAELTHNTIEGLIGEWELLGVGLTEADAFVGSSGCIVEHGLIEVGGNDGNRGRKGVGEAAREDAGACGEFEELAVGKTGEACHEVGGIRLEEQRAHIAVVEFGDRALKSVIQIRHGKS